MSSLGEIAVEKKIFHTKMRHWIKENIFDYPWRKTESPYNILISEILLQKTDFKKVLAIYNDFIAEFPDAISIKNAEISNLNSYFIKNGLIYKSNRLKQISSQVLGVYGGKIPDKKEELMSLYGVGDYISNAVLCFAFKKKVPLVDTNIIRIYGRIFGIKTLKTRPHTDKEIWNFAEEMLPEEDYVEYNYALLDFASDICRAKKPLCEKCPMEDICKHRKKVK